MNYGLLLVTLGDSSTALRMTKVIFVELGASSAMLRITKQTCHVECSDSEIETSP
ncbi:MAG: hypothetical protein IJ301_02990 [Clostridia bacterium]|nr:hypothetical protein [Clostridia bacterium]